ncbi:MAG TPA: 2OG-Fe(II) oxygenase [Polyangiaceae bacterium LLY-WYZ-15_(1-7)]|nr:SanC [Myxococcales bacterium]MAT28961.1 SanC [Sandaracinus sp.]HJK91796.1 2OG-Fe(II) oxygenase [Polyangiaceae bacterium LLY-WYZ-15_(1-7)]MBJ70327.1 SanC [Sandaracinus sp.]HJL02838.1 2OG-Fe(II) oxygenase [Polyangiaceae bacterium LLY-WYZ-15_(1-7)]
MRASFPFLERRALRPLAVAHRDAWAKAAPFPHVVLDDWLPEGLAVAAAEAFPSAEFPGWKRREYAEQRRLGGLQRKAFEGVAPVLRHLMNELNGMVFVDFLERLSGQRGLIGDPFFRGAGLHATEPGGHLALHADFDRDRFRGLARRMTALVYLTPRWEAAWGGELELWDAGRTDCVRAIAPRLGRLVVMAHGDDHWHGHPKPLASPPGVLRQSVAAYYYVADGQPGAEGHGAIW